MLSIDINHSDSDEFILSKDDLTKITGANISVKVDDTFMNEVKYSSNPKYKYKWDKLIHQAWKTAEPGVLFIDTIHRESPAACYGKEWLETSTNPCGRHTCPK